MHHLGKNDLSLSLSHSPELSVNTHLWIYVSAFKPQLRVRTSSKLSNATPHRSKKVETLENAKSDNCQFPWGWWPPHGWQAMSCYRWVVCIWYLWECILLWIFWAMGCSTTFLSGKWGEVKTDLQWHLTVSWNFLLSVDLLLHLFASVSPTLTFKAWTSFC